MPKSHAKPNIKRITHMLLMKMADFDSDIEEQEDIPELEPWANTPITLSNVNRFLRDYGYTKISVKTVEETMIQRFRDERIHGCMDIEINLRLNNREDPAIGVAAKKPNSTGNGARYVIEVLYSWYDLYQLIMKLRKTAVVGSAININHEYLNIIQALHQRVLKIENHQHVSASRNAAPRRRTAAS